MKTKQRQIKSKFTPWFHTLFFFLILIGIVYLVYSFLLPIVFNGRTNNNQKSGGETSDTTKEPSDTTKEPGYTMSGVVVGLIIFIVLIIFLNYGT